MTFNYNKKFSTNEGPTLEDFELGYIFAACTELEKYPQITSQPPLDELPCITVIMLRDQAKHLFDEAYPQLLKAVDEGLNMSQLGYEAFLASNSQKAQQLNRLSVTLKESLLFLFNFYGEESTLELNHNNHIVVSFPDKDYQEDKEQQYASMYQSLLIQKLKP